MKEIHVSLLGTTGVIKLQLPLSLGMTFANNRRQPVMVQEKISDCCFKGESENNRRLLRETTQEHK